MKRLKLFPKTFLVSIGLFAALIILVHALVYTLMPQFYLQQKEREAADNLMALVAELRGKSTEEMRRISQEFASMKNVNITLTVDGRDQYFQGFQSINIVTDSGKSVDTSVVKIADGQTVDPRSVILRQGSVADNQGQTIAVKLLADVAPVTQAKLATLQVLPYTMIGSLLVALIFSYIYSRFITRPIRQMAAVTTTMQQLEKGAHYPVSSHDEIGVLGRNINELYQNLWQTIRSLEHENKRITQLEKEKIAFLRAASHELKTPLAALRIMLENMQLNIGEYKNRDQYLTESVAQVDHLAAMVNDVLRSGSVAEQALHQEKRLRIDKLVAEVVDDYRLLAKTRSMTFTVNTEPTTIRANRDMMRHVISNLVSNAVRHGDAGSVIKITCNQHELAIENACKPLTKQQLQHVFDPFYRSLGTTKQHADSSGIGLYTVKMLLDAKGLDYEFVPHGQGMRFVVRFA
ncbi:HAMP domain-containing sensor histidine kinase [Candidatus Nanosynbacter lyticus]|uniref:HAMP domain-containing sensor histidine kinase n=1 Tax=Candidatus Nanosynbacter lyticus TaxID=2093824 RepID=UPI002555210C|nr:HAMP domain-containing sensor histidine kinase [Candidatus Nanosynbacter lyticus]WLD46699.1 HAMP domain-containing histidine kinase [Candidatus Nanosynbacter lyticus]